jgi:hypothetical protein
MNKKKYIRPEYPIIGLSKHPIWKNNPKEKSIEFKKLCKNGWQGLMDGLELSTIKDGSPRFRGIKKTQLVAIKRLSVKLFNLAFNADCKLDRGKYF